ncbi:unnamed protein product [Rhodiola kirilowii]
MTQNGGKRKAQMEEETVKGSNNSHSDEPNLDLGSTRSKSRKLREEERTDSEGIVEGSLADFLKKGKKKKKKKKKKQSLIPLLKTEEIGSPAFVKNTPIVLALRAPTCDPKVHVMEDDVSISSDKHGKRKQSELVEKQPVEVNSPRAQSPLLEDLFQPVTPIYCGIDNAQEATHVDHVVVAKGIMNNVSEESPGLANSLAPSDVASSGNYREKEGTELLENDDHIVPGSSAAEIPHLEDSILLSAFAAAFIPSRDNKAKEVAPQMPNASEKTTSVNNNHELGNPHFANSVHQSDSHSSTGDKSEEPTTRLTQTAETGDGSATSPTRSSMLSLSEVMKICDNKSSLKDAAAACPEPALITVERYRVREEYAATALIILRKHGDILANTSLKGSLPSHLLEMACTIYQTLEKSEFIDLTVPELESMHIDVCDLMKMKVDISWLAKRLDDICSAKKVQQQYADIMNRKNQNQQIIEELTKELKIKKEMMQAIQHDIKSIEEKLETEETKFESVHQTISENRRKVQQFYGKSLVDGI